MTSSKGDNRSGDQTREAEILAKFEAEGMEVEWTAEEVATYLKMSKSLIYDLCHKRQIPHRRIDLPGRERPLFRFRKGEIDTWRENYSQVVTVDEAKQ